MVMILFFNLSKAWRLTSHLCGMSVIGKSIERVECQCSENEGNGAEVTAHKYWVPS
jgi:hypothetical protein